VLLQPAIASRAAKNAANKNPGAANQMRFADKLRWQKRFRRRVCKGLFQSYRLRVCKYKLHYLRARKYRPGNPETLSRFLDFARANARCADLNAFVRARHQGAYGLQIGIPAAAPGIVGVADDVAIARSLAAVFTLHCHDSSY